MIFGRSDIRNILNQLRDPDGPEVVHVGAVTPDALGHWPNRVTNDIVITRRQRNHYLDQHPEMIEFEEDLVRILFDPDEVHTVGMGGSTAAFYGRQDATHDVMAIVSISENSGLRNSVITARRQYLKRKDRPAEAIRKVWSK